MAGGAISEHQAAGRHREMTQTVTHTAGCAPGPALVSTLWFTHSGSLLVAGSRKLRVSEYKHVELCTGSPTRRLVSICSFNSHSCKAGVTVPFLWVIK